MIGFDEWKKGFDAWEKATADIMETWLKSPLVLEPAGSMLSAVSKLKAAQDELVAKWWGSIGLPTKRDQERTLHRINELESKLLDLEEKLEEKDAKSWT
ncbi:MAG: hypothetical protein HYV07_18655 [Deltaproteobacteria bacterium]|nr:hypothetical protein [Deltaproteobacteria bacterium]